MAFHGGCQGLTESFHGDYTYGECYDKCLEMADCRAFGMKIIPDADKDCIIFNDYCNFDTTTWSDYVTYVWRGKTTIVKKFL